MTFFTAEDFNVSSELKCGDGIGPVFAATLANEKLQREAKVVYGNTGISTWDKVDDCAYTGHYTHRALLICVEELPKKECEHEPQWSEKLCAYDNICVKCGVKLKAKWEVVDEQR